MKSTPTRTVVSKRTRRLEALARRGLGRGALGAHLARDAAGLALGGRGGELGLLGLLGLRGRELLLLGLLDGLGAGRGAGLGALGAPLLDHIERSTNDGALGLDGAAGPLLGDFLRRGSVLCSFCVEAPLSPGGEGGRRRGGLGAGCIVPQRYPCGAGGGRGWSRR